MTGTHSVSHNLRLFAQESEESSLSLKAGRSDDAACLEPFEGEEARLL